MPAVPGTSSIWLRPGLRLDAFLAGAACLDTALFDVDGVLIDTRRSYRLAVCYAAEHIVRVLNGLTDAPAPMVTPEDVAAFKLAGGFNSDWDAAQLFAALWTAKLREWRGTPEADVPVREWAARASAAARAGRGGMAWVRATVPASAIPDDETARWAMDEQYWGAELLRAFFGREPLYAPDAPGLVHNEALLLGEELLPALATSGITKLGLITGRVGPEVGWAVTRLAAGSGLRDDATEGIGTWAESEHGRSPFGAIVPATVYAKPDPRALVEAVRALGARAALYTGDTADDLDLVLRYRREAQPADPALPPVLAVQIASGDEAAVYRERGADIVIPHVAQLPAALTLLEG
jgi:phosphoglycolate phosphatase-like HAD superfamily hydrolase